MPRGTCIICGCRDMRACPGGCAWIDKGHQICSAHTPFQIDSARRKLAAKPARPQAAVSGPLSWRSIWRKQAWVAHVPAGRYVLAANTGGWAVHWYPKKGRAKLLAAAVPTAEGKALCERHRLENISDRMLEDAGAGALVQPALKGEASVWRKGKRRGA
jgi:hypothetical protein